MTKKDVTVYIGRFNPFHNGHAYVLEQALLNSKLVIVLVGSAGQARSLKNPFTFTEREQMIQNFADDFALKQGFRHQGDKDNTNAQLIILPLRDFPYSNNLWIKSVQATVSSAIAKYSESAYGESAPVKDIHLTGSDRDDSTWYLSAFPQWKLDLVSAFRPPLSATSVREVLYTSDLSVDALDSLEDKLPGGTLDFLIDFARSGGLEPLRSEYKFITDYKAAWAVAPYAPTFNTADAVVIQSGHVLVVKRGAQPGKGLWALPGGFVNQKERIKDAAVRELLEETGIRLAEGKRGKEITEAMLEGSIRDKEIFDDPERSLRGRTITVAYLMRLDDTKPLAKVKGQNVPHYESGGKEIVETEDAFWLPLDEALSKTELWFEDHHSIVEWAVSVKD